MFGWIFLVILIILAIWYLNNGNFNLPSGQKEQESPIEKLKKRFAKGEISKEEYEEKKDILSK